MADEVPRQIAAAPIPPEVASGFANSGISQGQLTGVGDLGAVILAGVPEQFRASVEPHIPAIVAAIHQAFSIATSATFLIGIVASLAAAGLVLLLREAPIRADEPVVEPARRDAEAAPAA
jgi:hypothetical protein